MPKAPSRAEVPTRGFNLAAFACPVQSCAVTGENVLQKDFTIHAHVQQSDFAGN